MKTPLSRPSYKKKQLLSNDIFQIEVVASPR